MSDNLMRCLTCGRITDPNKYYLESVWLPKKMSFCSLECMSMWEFEDLKRRGGMATRQKLLTPAVALPDWWDIGRRLRNTRTDKEQVKVGLNGLRRNGIFKPIFNH